jgi:hypothetical protein
MMFVGRFAGEPVLLKSPRDDVPAEAFKATVGILYKFNIPSTQRKIREPPF